jgi:hypothetical protein
MGGFFFNNGKTHAFGYSLRISSKLLETPNLDRSLREFLTPTSTVNKINPAMRFFHKDSMIFAFSP